MHTWEVMVTDIFNVSKRVTLLTGKYKGLSCIPVCYVVSHPLSSDKRVQVKVQTGLGWKTLLVNFKNLKVIM
ncbi:hypothetical protein HWD03_gp123 [Alteromonas phage vB_AmeM_PT11-V22]|uniref:Uncharacterized protein n=1 Tax=Alteromonas phage vB_AmeM_PT11-V22 TaxID=2704031 RepID=A0A6C0R2R7_9CAUD|nr:hypothetical protein HWD03_gp123 [Alteromonas phage vB_AmeM_PT11-V22]QHZ59854.1 hypothetical protein [Alteromonas phage vB_AmeM_PT11-V22]